MMKLLILSLVATATAFQPVANKRASLALQAQVDEEKIKDAAEHFGKYPVEEIEQMKNELHMERIQSMMFDRDNVISNEHAVEQRLLEKELEMQLNLLKEDMDKETHDMNLFPEVEDSMEELPHLKDGTLAEKVHEQEKLFILEKYFLEENVAETIAFCSILAIMMMAPKFF